MELADRVLNPFREWAHVTQSQHPGLAGCGGGDQALLRAIAKIEREMATVERQVQRLQEQQSRCDDGRSGR